MTTFDLRSLRIRSGEEHREAKEIELPALELGGQRYIPVPERVEAELVVTRASTGTLFELRFDVRLHGPCYRCLEDAVLELPIAGREYQATNPDGAEELATQYVVDDKLDLAGWGRDATALELPNKILCRDDCAGLCPVCGRNLNDEPHTHEDEPLDPRWSGLAELRDRL